MANSITMTPGTITVDVQDDLFLIHCLDESFDMGHEGFEMEDRIMKIEGGHQPAADVPQELPVQPAAEEALPVQQETTPEITEEEAAQDE